MQRTLRAGCLFVLGMLTLVAHAAAQEVVEPPAKSESTNAKASTEEPQRVDPAQKTKATESWKSLLPEKGLEGWEITDFGAGGKVQRDGEMLVIEMGDPLNGITSKMKDFPTGNYEIACEAMRVEGEDFFVGLTFPIGEGFCTWIVGGWGGGMVGLSSVDGADASENSTTTYEEFESGKWYQLRLRVDDEFIRAWIDDNEYFRQEIADHEFSTRIEVYASHPLGYCTYQSKVALKNFRYRLLGDAKSRKAAEMKSDADMKTKETTETPAQKVAPASGAVKVEK